MKEKTTNNNKIQKNNNITETQTGLEASGREGWCKKPPK